MVRSNAVDIAVQDPLFNGGGGRLPMVLVAKRRPLGGRATRGALTEAERFGMNRR